MRRRFLWKVAGSLERDRRLTVTIGLPVRDPERLAQEVELVSDPDSPMYRQYVTPEEFAKQYGAEPAAYERLLGWARGRGLAVEAHPNRLVAHVTGSVAALEDALHVRLGYALRPDGSRFFGPTASRRSISTSRSSTSAASTTTSRRATRRPAARESPA